MSHKTILVLIFFSPQWYTRKFKIFKEMFTIQSVMFFIEMNFPTIPQQSRGK